MRNLLRYFAFNLIRGLKAKSIIATFVLVTFVITQSYAQQQSTPKYNNDLDRAMCVFSHDVKKAKTTFDTLVGGSIFGIAGIVFFYYKSLGFKSKGGDVAEELVAWLLHSPSEKSAVGRILTSTGYFKGEFETFTISEGDKLILEWLKKIPDNQLQALLSNLDMNDLERVQAEGRFSEKYSQLLKLAKSVPQSVLKDHEAFNDSLRKKLLSDSGYKKIAKIFSDIDKWCETPINRRKIQDAISNEITKRSLQSVKIHLSQEEELRDEMNKSFEKATRATKTASYVGLTSLGIFILAQIYMELHIVDQTDVTLSEATLWDLPDVRNYFSKPDNQGEMENLVNQAKDCGCY